MMELKKSPKADLEKKRVAFLQIGLVITLSLTLIAFDWKSKPDNYIADNYTSFNDFEPDQMPVTRPEIPIPVKKPDRLIDIMLIVPDDIFIDDNPIWDPEVNPDTPIDYGSYSNEPEPDDKPVDFLPIEDMPTFNGGIPATEFRKYISQNLHYPEIAIENNVKGKVYVQFVIDTRGKLVNAEIIGSVDPALDKEALRVVNSSPLWSPGKQRGKPVKVRFTFPIAFILQ